MSRLAQGFNQQPGQGVIRGAEVGRCEQLTTRRALQRSSHALVEQSPPNTWPSRGTGSRHPAAAAAASYTDALTPCVAAPVVPGRGSALVEDPPAHHQEPDHHSQAPSQQHRQQHSPKPHLGPSPPSPWKPAVHHVRHQDGAGMRGAGRGRAKDPAGPGPHSEYGRRGLSPAPSTPSSRAAPSLQPSAADPETRLPPRSPEQQHWPSSPPSSSSSSSLAGPAFTARHYRGRHRGGSGSTVGSVPPPRPPPRGAASAHRHDAILTNVLSTSNWYQLRAVLLSGVGVGAGGSTTSAAAVGGGAFASDPAAVLAVLRHLATITQYDMRPPEAAELGSFLEHWLLRHTGALRLMSPTELSLCLHALAKLAHAIPAPPTPWVVAWFNAAQPYLLEAAFRPRDVSLALWALSRMQQLRLPAAALQLLLAAAEPHLPRFNGQDLAQVALALAALRTRQGGGGAAAAATTTIAAAAAPLPVLPSTAWQDRFLARCGHVIPSCGPQALANLLHGAVRAGLDLPDWLLGDLCAALYRQLPSCTPQALANVLSALAARGYVPEEGWVERFFAESAARMDTGRSGPAAGGSGGARSGSGYDGAGVEEDGDGVEDAAAAAAAEGGGRRHQRCNAEDLAHMAAAAAQLRLDPPRWWVARLYDAVERRMPYASPRQLAQLLYGVALLQQSLAAAAAGTGPKADADGNTYGGGRADAALSPTTEASVLTLGPTASASAPRQDGAPAAPAAANPDVSSAAAPPPPRSLLVAWHRAAAAALPRFNPLDAAHSLWSLVALGERPPAEWLTRLLLHCRPVLEGTPPGDLAVLLWSLSALGFRPSWSWLRDCMDACEQDLHRMEPRDTAMLATALVRLGGRPTDAWRDGLLGAVRSQLPVLSARELSQAAWALYRLRVQPPAGWLEALAAELASRWQRLAEASQARKGAGGGEVVAVGVLREEVRHVVMTLWVVSLWLGVQTRRQRQRRRQPLLLGRPGILPSREGPAQARRPVSNGTTAATQQPQALTLQPLSLPSGRGLGSGGSVEGGQPPAVGPRGRMGEALPGPAATAGAAAGTAAALGPESTGGAQMNAPADVWSSSTSSSSSSSSSSSGITSSDSSSCNTGSISNKVLGSHVLTPRPAPPQALLMRPPAPVATTAAAAVALGASPSTVAATAMRVGGGGVGSTSEPAVAAPAARDAPLVHLHRSRCRVTPRMLRRRRAKRPGHLATSLGGNEAAAATLRRRLADEVVGPAMDAVLALLAEAEHAAGGRGGGTALARRRFHGAGGPTAAGASGNSGGASFSSFSSSAAVGWTAQDAALLLGALRSLNLSARAAAQRRPEWAPLLLAATRPLLRELPLSGLHRVAGGLAALRVGVDPAWASECVAAVAPYVTAAALPAADKVHALRRMFELQVTAATAAGAFGSVAEAAAAAPPPPSRRRELPAARTKDLGSRPASAGGMASGQQAGPICKTPGGPAGLQLQLLGPDLPLEPLLAEVLRQLHQQSLAAGPLVRLHVELLKAKVRLRKLAAALRAAAEGLEWAAGSGETRANERRVAAVRSVRAAAATVAAAWPPGSAEGLSGAAFAAAAMRVRAAVAAAAAAVADAAAVVEDDDDRCRRRFSRRVPAIPETQRPWIWNRARRTAVAFQAQLSPVLVLKLVEMIAIQLAGYSRGSRGSAAAAAAAAAQQPLARAPPPAVGAPGGQAAPASHPGLPADLGRLRPEWLTWMAAATAEWRPRMMRCHRLRVAAAWRAILDSLQRRGPAEVELQRELAARLAARAVPVGTGERLAAGLRTGEGGPPLCGPVVQGRRSGGGRGGGNNLRSEQRKAGLRQHDGAARSGGAALVRSATAGREGGSGAQGGGARGLRGKGQW